MKLALPGSACGFEIGAPQIVNPPRVLNVRLKFTGWPSAESGTLAVIKAFMSSAYVGEPTGGVLFFSAASGAGNVLPLTWVYGKISGSSMLLNAPPCPPHPSLIWPCHISTRHPSNPLRQTT